MFHLDLKQVCSFIVLACVLVTTTSCAKRQREVRTLEELHTAYAMRFLEPTPHLELAKYLRDNGNRLQAFFNLEIARRHRFKEDEFNEAFRSVFQGVKPPDVSPAAEAALLDKHASDPNSIDTAVKLANLYTARKDWAKAKEYISKAIRLEPEHFEDTMALAEILRREGNTEEADRVLREYTRQYPDSKQAYQLRVLDLQEQKPDEAKLVVLEAIKKFPNEGDFVYGRAAIFHSEGKMQEAEEQYVRAAEMSPESAYIQAWVGRFFHKVKEDNHRALKYYLNAYFLNPHFYETEFVESRVQKISAALEEIDYEQQLKSGVPLTKILEDPNPLMAQHAIEQLSEKWEPDHLKMYLNLMGHEDGGVRWYATMAICKNVDRSFDETLRRLLQNKDLRKRGLAAYIAACLWKQESFDILRKMLREEAQLLRYDAISALMGGGPEGREILSAHLPHESNPKLKEMIERAMWQENHNPGSTQSGFGDANRPPHALIALIAMSAQ